MAMVGLVYVTRESLRTGVQYKPMPRLSLSLILSEDVALTQGTIAFQSPLGISDGGHSTFGCIVLLPKAW